MQSEEKRIEVSGIELALKMWGPAGGRRVVALHGWLDNAASFDAMIRGLGEEFRVAALDFPGHGLSGWRSEADAYYFADWVHVVVGVFDALEWQHCSLVGHSMGGAVASLVGAVAPKRVERLVFLDALGPMTTPQQEAPKQLRRALRQEKALMGRTPPRYPSRDRMVEALSTVRGGSDTEGLRRMVQRGSRQTDDGQWYFDYDPKLKAPSRVRFSEQQVVAFLEAIEAPVLLVRPEQGLVAAREGADARLGAVSDLEVVDVKGGHDVHLSGGREVCERVGRFLS